VQSSLSGTRRRFSRGNVPGSPVERPNVTTRLPRATRRRAASSDGPPRFEDQVCPVAVLGDFVHYCDAWLRQWGDRHDTVMAAAWNTSDLGARAKRELKQQAGPIRRPHPMAMTRLPSNEPPRLIALSAVAPATPMAAAACREPARQQLDRPG
jgi:hypothetical protein